MLQGSRRFRSIIECYKAQYQAALTKYDKTSVTRDIYDLLCHVGSRFLKRHPASGDWQEITPSAARDKIGHALRFANRTSRNGNQKAAKMPEEEVAPVISSGCSSEAGPASQPMVQVSSTTSSVNTATNLILIQGHSQPLLPGSSSPCAAAQARGPCMTDDRKEAVLNNGRSYLAAAIAPIIHDSYLHPPQQGQCGLANSLLTTAASTTTTMTNCRRDSHSSSSDGSLALLDHIFVSEKQLCAVGDVPFPTLDHHSSSSSSSSSRKCHLSQTTTTSTGPVVNDAAATLLWSSDADFDSEILSVLL